MLILASNSPRRKYLLDLLGLKYSVFPSDSEEVEDATGNPERIAVANALKKAESVAGKIGKGVVIGADTVVARAGRIFGKPRDAAEAFRILKKLQGRTHTVITGIAVIDAGKKIIMTGCEKSRVKLSSMDNNEVKKYVDTGEPFDKAGAYAIQGRGAMYIERIDGCYSNVVGLPLPRLAEMLKKLGVRI